MDPHEREISTHPRRCLSPTSSSLSWGDTRSAWTITPAQTTAPSTVTDSSPGSPQLSGEGKSTCTTTPNHVQIVRNCSKIIKHFSSIFDMSCKTYVTFVVWEICGLRFVELIKWSVRFVFVKMIFDETHFSGIRKIDEK